MSTMFVGMLSESCYFDERQDTRDSHGKYEYTRSEKKPCLFLQESGTKLKTPPYKDVLIIGYFLLAESINEYDRIIFEDVVYDIVPGGVVRRKSILNGVTQYWKVFVEKRRAYNEDEITISQRVTG